MNQRLPLEEILKCANTAGAVVVFSPVVIVALEGGCIQIPQYSPTKISSQEVVALFNAPRRCSQRGVCIREIKVCNACRPMGT